MKGQLIRTMTVLLAIGAMQVARAQSEGGPPLPRHLIEQLGTVSRVDAARQMVWIGRTPYKVTPKTQAYVGSRPMEDVRQLVIGKELAFTAGEGGKLEALWMDLPDAEVADDGKFRGGRR